MPLPGYELSYELSSHNGIHHRTIELEAYRRWEEAGRPEGMRPDGRPWAEYLWHQAEAVLAGSGNGDDTGDDHR